MQESVIEKKYNPVTKQFGFDEALIMLKQGDKVQRSGWNGKGMYLKLMQGYPVNGHLNSDDPDVKLPDLSPDGSKNITQGKPGQMHSHIILKLAGDSISWGPGYSDYVAWNPNNFDMFADDWQVVE
jgi:hypothetical protein